MKRAFLFALAVPVLAPAARADVAINFGQPYVEKQTLVAHDIFSDQVMTVTHSMPALLPASQLPVTSAARVLAVPQAPAAVPAAAAQIMALGTQLSAAQANGDGPKESLDQAFERSVSAAKGDSAPAAAPADKPAAPSLSPVNRSEPSNPQPPAPKQGFWQKHGDAITGGTVGAVVLGASTLILGAKSLEIPAFIGLLTALVPFLLRATTADGKTAFIPAWGQSAVGGALGLVAGWALGHFGYSTAMAGYGVMTGLFVPQFLQGLLKPTPDPVAKMFLSMFAGAGIGATLPVWVGAKYGRKLFGKSKTAAK